TLEVLSIFFNEQPWFVEALEYVALGIESTLPMSQGWQNFKQQSVEGFSILVLLTWFGSDSFKTYYYISTNAPLQFPVCGLIELSVDTIIVLQFIIFNHRMREFFELEVSNPRDMYLPF
ncbi:3077_t:CDS:2, partial [Dentiscutata heterogama]